MAAPDFSELKGQVALITGASRGIGAAAAAELAGHGAAVVLAARSRDAVEAGAEAIRAAGGSAVAVACDVSRYADVVAAADAAVQTFGGLDILVSNAGVIDPVARIEDCDPEPWGAAIDINVKGVLHGLRAAVPAMKARGGGAIVHLSSGAATSALEGWSHYCASKAAVLMLTHCAHKELAGFGIRVAGLSPGTVATDMQRVIKASGVNPVSQLDWEAHIPPEAPARAIAYLCLKEAADLAGGDIRLRDEETRRRVGLSV